MKKTKVIVIGIDAATWKVIKPNLKELPNFRKLIREGTAKSLVVEDKNILSPAIWCTIFSGKTSEEHGHFKFVEGGRLKKREELEVDFVWDILDKEYDIKVLQVPIVIPPFNFNCEYKPIGYGVSYDLKELAEDTERLTLKSLEILKRGSDIFIVVFSALDRIQHFHWGEPLVVDWYKKIDEIVGKIIPFGEKLIIVSDHGFCSRGEARVQTLPEKNYKGEPLKGDHHEEAILITKNIDYKINSHKDIFSAIIKSLK